MILAICRHHEYPQSEVHRLVSTARARGVAGGSLVCWESLLVGGLCGTETLSHLVKTGLKYIRRKCSLNTVIERK